MEIGGAMENNEKQIDDKVNNLENENRKLQNRIEELEAQIKEYTKPKENGSIDYYLDETLKLLKNMKNYDTVGFANQIYYWVRELDFFYSKLVNNQKKSPSEVFYQVKPSERPKEGQVAYFNLRRGYPKETYDGHYCYIVKDFGFKYIIIPTTSVKEDSADLNEKFEIDIELSKFTNNKVSRMQVSDIRVVDIQRLNQKKGIFDVVTDKQSIEEKIKEILFS